MSMDTKQASGGVGHTPGPWQAATTGPVMRRYSQPFGVAGGGTLICGCFGDIQGDVETAEANARLIAAAPDLLQALKDLLDGEGDMTAERVNRARDAIAKAVKS